MEKNLVLIVEGQKYYYDTKEELIEKIICKNYYDMTEKDKKNELEKRAIAHTMLEEIRSVNLKGKKQNYQTDAFIIDDEITHILSLAKFNKIVLLEKSEFECFGKYIKSIEKRQDTYIIINKFADEIMKNYIDNKYQ